MRRQLGFFLRMKPKHQFIWLYMKKCDDYRACLCAKYLCHHCFSLYVYACTSVPADICAGISFLFCISLLQLAFLWFSLFHKMCWWIEKIVMCKEVSCANTVIQNDCKHRGHDQPSWHHIEIYHRIHNVVLTDTAYRLVQSISSLNLCYSTHTVLSVSSNGASK